MCTISCFRREVLRETLREKLELEKALKVVERLLEDSVAEDFLIDCVMYQESSLLQQKPQVTARP